MSSIGGCRGESNESFPSDVGNEKLLSIIIPSFRDHRILEAISSIRAFSDLPVVRVIVVDGGSPPGLVSAMRAVLSDDDVLVSEPDEGIFDALNKGLDRVTTPYLGWIGTDDLLTGQVRASEVVAALEDADIFMTNLAFVDGDYIVRITHAWPSTKGLSAVGLHNPHYATFGRAELLQAERFDASDLTADISYFLRIFTRARRVAWTSKVGTLQSVGGFSNRSRKIVLKRNLRVLATYRAHANLPVAIVGVTLKLAYKSTVRLRYLLRPVHWPSRYPDAQNARLAGRNVLPSE